MESDETTSSNFYTAFPPNSVNVLASSTNSGKTTLALNIIQNFNLHCKRKVSKVLIVLCNSILNNASVYLDNKPEGLEIETTTLDDFDVESQLTEHCFLIFEDVQHLHNKILQSVNLHAHHDNLESVFIICQGLLGNKELYRLCSLAHRVILFFGSQAAVRLSKHLKASFFQDPELKEYLGKIIGHAEKNKDVLLLELNQINGEFKPKFLAISGVDKIGMNKPAVYYPHLNEVNDFNEHFDDNVAEIDDPNHNLPPGSFILVPAANVRKKSVVGQASAASDSEKDWNNLMHEIGEDLESAVKSNKLNSARNLVRFLLRSKSIGLSKEGKTIMINGQPKTKIALLDFIATAVRSNGPNEVIDEKYIPFARVLLNNHTPETLFKNKALVEQAIGERRKNIKGKKFKPNQQYFRGRQDGERRSKESTLDKKRAASRRFSDKFYE